MIKSIVISDKFHEMCDDAVKNLMYVPKSIYTDWYALNHIIQPDFFCQYSERN